MDLTVKADLERGSRSAAHSSAGHGAVPTAGRERTKAAVIGSDAEAIAVAHRVAAEVAKGAADRDRDRRLPLVEIDLYSDSGLWGIGVPKAWGGAGVSNATL